MSNATLDLRSSTEWPSFHQPQDTPSASQPKMKSEQGTRLYSLAYFLNGAHPYVRFYMTVSSIRCLHLCAYVCLSLTLSLSCLFLAFSPRPLSLSALPSEFSEVVDLFTSCSVPLPPFPPELEMTGVTWLCLKWLRPTSSPKEDDIYYILEMEEEGSVGLASLLTNAFK